MVIGSLFVRRTGMSIAMTEGGLADAASGSGRCA